MYFNSILIVTLAIGARTGKIPALPAPAAAADVVDPVVSDAPVFRGRGTRSATTILRECSFLTIEVVSTSHNFKNALYSTAPF